MKTTIKEKAASFYFYGMIFWYVIGFGMHVVMIPDAIKYKDMNLLIVLAVWWAITLAARTIRHAVRKKNKEKEENARFEYRSKYVTEIPVEDELFGRVVFELDANLDGINVTDYRMEKPLGNNDDVRLTADVRGQDVSPIVWGLRYLYKNSQHILGGMYEYTLECCKNYEEKDKNGNPYSIEYVRENLSVSSIYIQHYDNEMMICLMGDISGDNGESLLGSHSITAEINVTVGKDPLKKSVEYGLVG